MKLWLPTFCSLAVYKRFIFLIVQSVADGAFPVRTRDVIQRVKYGKTCCGECA